MVGRRVRRAGGQRGGQRGARPWGQEPGRSEEPGGAKQGPEDGRWREKLGPDRRLEAGGRSRGCRLRAAAGWRAGVFSLGLGRGAGRARGDNRWSAGKGDAGQFWAANEAAKFEILCTTLFVAVVRWRGQARGDGSAQRCCRMVGDGEISRLGWEVESSRWTTYDGGWALVLANHFGGPQPDPLKNAPTVQWPVASAHCRLPSAQSHQVESGKRPHAALTSSLAMHGPTGAGFKMPGRGLRRLVRAVGSLLSSLFSVSLGPFDGPVTE